MKTYPYPLGLKLRQLEREMEAEHREEGRFPNFRFTVCASFSALVRFLAAVVLSDYFRSGAPDEKLNRELVKKMFRPSERHFFSIFEKVIEASFAVHPLSRSLEESYVNKKGEIKKSMKELSAFRDRVAHALDESSHEKVMEKAEELREIYGCFGVLAEWRLVVQTDAGFYTFTGMAPKRENAAAAVPEKWRFQPVLVPGKGHKEEPDAMLSLWPFLHFSPTEHGTGHVIEWDELFLYNSIEGRRINYIGYRYHGQIDQSEAGIDAEEEQYRRFISHIERIARESSDIEYLPDYSHLSNYHREFFVGRTEILKAFEKFAAGEHEYSYAELRSLAGVGKTALCAYLYGEEGKSISPDEENLQQFVKQHETLYVWYFCSHNNDQNNPSRFLKSMMSQIWRYLGHSFGAKKEELTAMLRGDLNTLAGNYLQLLQRAGEQLEKKRKRLVIVIDGLDEAVRRDGTELEIPRLIPPIQSDEVPAAADFELPPRIRFVYSYRVYPSGDSFQNQDVERRLAHIPHEKVLSLTGSEPMQGLTREDVTEIVKKAREKAVEAGVDQPDPTEETLEKIWEAAVRSYEELNEQMRL